MKAFLDVDIGDVAAFQERIQQYSRGQQFFDIVAPQYGLTGTLTDVNDEALNMLQDAYASDPSWSSKGPALFRSPASLRAGRLVVELYKDVVPKTVENFKCLCTGEKGKGKSSGKPLHYKGCKFHRIVTGFVAQGGDFVKGDGSGGDSIYGGKFNDEKAGLKLKHDQAGLLAMANSGKNSGTCQFYITLAPAPQCDGKHVVFGKVVEGLDVVERIGKEAATADGEPKVDVVIADCGVL